MKSLLILTVFIIVAKAEDPDVGFNLLYTSNEKEFRDVPVRFEYPLPKWLEGTLVRNGGGGFEMGKRKLIHAFDAYSKLTSWKFHGNGSVSFSTVFLKTESYNRSAASQDVAPYLLLLGVNPPFSALQRTAALLRGIDNMNVNVFRYPTDDGGTGYFALNDYWKVYEFSIGRLDVVGGPVNPPIFSRPPASPGAEIGVLSQISSAHPLPEPRRPSFLTFLSEIRLLPGEKDAISLVRIHTVTRREVVARWEVDRVPYVHSFSVTENHAVVFASPYHVSVLKMVDTARALDSLEWRGDSPCMIYVVDLRSGQVHTLKTEAMFFMHHANAFELDDSRLVVDIAVYEDPSFINQMTLENLLDPNKRNGIDLAPQLKRYTLNITTKAVSIQTFHTKRDRFISRLEFPTINEDYRARNYCYVYGFVGKMDGKRLATNALVKKDLCGNGMDRYWSESYHYGSELWFVPNPAGTREDDGVLLSPVLNGTKGQSYLAVFDARSMKLMNVGYLPTYIPTTIHGRFFENI